MKLKKTLACVLAVASAFTVSAPQSIILTQPTAITASAVDAKAWGDNASYTVDAKTATVTVTGTGDLKGTLSGSPLTGDTAIKNVIIEEGITSIPSEAFKDCINLESVSIPSTVMSVGSDAFKNTAIYESQTDDLIFVDKWLVAHNYEKTDEVTKIDIPDGVVGIANRVFYNKYFNALQEIAFPDSLMYIGESALDFDGYLPPKITELNLPTKNDLYIGDGAFQMSAGELTSLTIPSNVKKIGSKAFCGNSGLETLVIEEGVTSIGTSAFAGCSNLENVSLPESLNKVQIDAFGGTKIFKEQEDAKQPLIFVDGWIVDSGSKASFAVAPEGTVGIAEYALAATTGRSDNAKIDEIILPDGIKHINDYAFAENYVVKSVNLPDSIVDIGASAFYECSGLEEIILPSGITEIKDETFSGCSSIGEIIIPENVKAIGEKAFFGCNSVTSIQIGENVETLSENVFSVEKYGNKETVETLDINIKEIPANIFGCRVFENIIIGENVEKIEKGSFSTGKSNSWSNDFLCDIQNMTILNHDCEIEDSSFASYYIYGYTNSTAHTYADTNHAKKTNVYNFIPLDPQPETTTTTEATTTTTTTTEPTTTTSTTTTEPTTTSTTTTTAKPTTTTSTTTITTTASTTTTEKTTTTVTTTEAINTTVTTSTDVKEYTEGTHGVLTYHKYEDHVVIVKCDKSAEGTLDIPDEIEKLPVTEIGDYAFVACENLTEITIPDGVTEIGEGAFGTCYNLTKIVIPDSVTKIGNTAFAECHNLAEITIPDGVTAINGGVFSNCRSLKEITIPDGVTIIGSIAFRGCTSLTKVTIPASVTEIKDEAFGYCEDLTELTILNPNCEIWGYSMVISNGIRGEEMLYYYDGVIRGYENSTAQEHAEKYNYTFVSLGSSPEKTELEMGDVDGNGAIDASDASVVLAEYALRQTGGNSSLTPAQEKAADVNGDGVIDASDASNILAYYAHVSTGGKNTFEEFLKNMNS